MRRREFLHVLVSTVGSVVVYTLGQASELPVVGDATLKVPLRYFTESEALDIGAAAERIFPSDESTPGANQLGVVIYIDRQLAGPYGRDRDRYTQPPFEEGAAEYGYQGAVTPREIYHEGLKTIEKLNRLTAEEQDRKLKEIEKSVFFSLLRSHTIEGVLCDPMHGGNVGMAGWRLIGFPGPRMSNFREVDQYYGREFRPEPVNLRQATGKTVRPSEDES